MPRYAAWLRYPDGSTAVVHSSKPIKACICQAKVSAYLCDYLVGDKTCDAPLCDDCRVPQGADVDYCPTHDSEVSHPIQLSEVSDTSDRSRASHMSHVTDARGQEYLL